MKSSKTVRNIDSMGRIVLPVEMRKSLGVNVGDKVNIELESNRIVITSPKNVCVFCGSKYELLKHLDGYVCHECVKALSSGL